MEVNRNLSVMSNNPQAIKLQSAIYAFAQAALQNDCVKNDQQVMAAMRVLFQLLEPYASSASNEAALKTDLQFLYSRIVGSDSESVFDDASQLEQIAALGETKLCESLIARIDAIIERADEAEIMPHLKKLERIAVQPAHRERLNFFKRALGISATTGE